MRTSLIPAVLLLSAFLAAPALAEKPDHAGGGKHGGKHERKADKHERKAQKNDHGHQDKHAGRDDRQPRRGAYFDDTHRDSVRRYYTHSHAHCPPGLARKNNGCMPPGQAKKWEVGHRVPPGVTVYAVPQPILVNLPPPPPRHRYIRVSGDILLIAIGTQMVVDGISGIAN